METTIYHLIGPPAVGKYTIGKELAARSGARLVDNHSVANVLFNLLDQDGVTPLPDAIWPLVGQVRAAVIETLLTVSPPDLSFVFTNFMRGEDEREYAVFLEMVAVADGTPKPLRPRAAAMRSRRDLCGASSGTTASSASSWWTLCLGVASRPRCRSFARITPTPSSSTSPGFRRLRPWIRSCRGAAESLRTPDRDSNGVRFFIHACYP